MNYLRVKNFWDYQNADAWKKAKANKGGHKHPAWCKFYVARDMELDREKPMVRLVFYELLRLATVCENAIPNDSQAIAKAISTPTQATTQAIERLLEMGWLSETRTRRSSRKPSRKILHQIEIREEKKYKSSSNGYVVPEHAREKLLKVLTDGDRNTAHTVDRLARRYRLAEGDFAWAAECANGPGVVSPSGVAVSELKKRGEAKRAA